MIIVENRHSRVIVRVPGGGGGCHVFVGLGPSQRMVAGSLRRIRSADVGLVVRVPVMMMMMVHGVGRGRRAVYGTAASVLAGGRRVVSGGGPRAMSGS